MFNFARQSRRKPQVGHVYLRNRRDHRHADEQLKARISPRLRHWNQAIDEQMVKLFQSTQGDDEDAVTLMVMNRSLMRGLFIQDRYQTDPTYGLKVVLRWIEIVGPLLKLHKGNSG